MEAIVSMMLDIVEYRRNEFEVINEGVKPEFIQFLLTRLWFSPLSGVLTVTFLVIALISNDLLLVFFVPAIIFLYLFWKSSPLDLMKQDLFDRIRYYGFRVLFDTEKVFQNLISYTIIDSLTGEMKETELNTRQAVGYRIVAVSWEYDGSLPLNDPVSKWLDQYNRNSIVDLGFQIELVYSETQPGIPVIENDDLFEVCQLIHLFDEMFPRKTFFPPQEKVVSTSGKVKYNPLDNDFVTEINEMINETDLPEPFDSYFKKFVYMG
ncbi:MAG: hypothetical protein D6732_11395 [Methanobacteriota archaeon]|nr:MAG: hypothetical protein D6732_11395 [Euryarchaeota archaeon]